MIEFSERESKLFNLKFGRTTIPSGFTQWQNIVQESEALGLDYLRLKVVDPDSHFMASLSALGIRSYFTGIIRLYKKKVEPDVSGWFNKDLIFNKVDTGDKQLLKTLIKDMYAEAPMGYYQYPELSERFPADLQMENISAYFSDYFSGSNAGLEAYIGFIGKQPVACFALDLNQPKVAVCMYAGVIQAYRSKGVFRDAIKYLNTLAQDRGIRQLIAGARLENVSSQYGMAQEIGICYGHEWVYMLSFKNNSKL